VADSSMCLVLLRSMRRPASGCYRGPPTGTVTSEAIGVDEKDMKPVPLGRQGTGIAADPGRFG